MCLSKTQICFILTFCMMFLIGSAVLYVEIQEDYTCNITDIQIGFVEAVVYFNVIEIKKEKTLVETFKTNPEDRKEWIQQFKIGEIRKCWINNTDNAYLNKRKTPEALIMILVSSFISLCCFCPPLVYLLRCENE